jgi:N-acyl-D-amino-acid deacylase
VEQQRLDLDARAFELLQRNPLFRVSHAPDSRLETITVRQLLHHTGGWDRDRSFDPMFRPVAIAREMGEPPPAQARTIIRYMLGQRLDCDPGTRYAYSNFGYCVLGRIIEQVTGASYEEFVRREILAPIGVNRMRLGKSRDDEQAPGEVRYYSRRGDETNSVFPPTSKKVPLPYGGFCLEAMDAHGGWIGSAEDLACFAAALHDPRRSPLLKPETFRLMEAPPPPPVWRKPDGGLDDAYYACGWMARPVGRDEKANYWHAGSLPGTSSLLVRRSDGLGWIVLFNQRSEDKKLPDSAIDPALHRAASAVTEWPAGTAFPSL